MSYALILYCSGMHCSDKCNNPRVQRRESMKRIIYRYNLPLELKYSFLKKSQLIMVYFHKHWIQRYPITVFIHKNPSFGCISLNGLFVKILLRWFPCVAWWLKFNKNILEKFNYYSIEFMNFHKEINKNRTCLVKCNAISRFFFFLIIHCTE